MAKGWLSEIPDDKSVSDINIPGTHDSAAIYANALIWLPRDLFYANQYSILTAQLVQGVRLLDIRLSVRIDGTGDFFFNTCHGEKLSDLGFNEFQTFQSAMGECKSYLAEFGTEFIAMSLKIDAWNGFDNKSQEVYQALKQILDKFPIVTGRSEMPLLESLRGKIYLLNRINNDLSLGVPMKWGNNTSGQLLRIIQNKRDFEIYVQDRYENFGSNPEQEKLEYFENALSKTTNGQMLVNFASATQGYKNLRGVYIIDRILASIGSKPSGDRRQRLGWSLFDFSTSGFPTDIYGYVNIVDVIIDSNMGYPKYGEVFKVYGERDEF